MDTLQAFLLPMRKETDPTLPNAVQHHSNRIKVIFQSNGAGRFMIQNLVMVLNFAIIISSAVVMAKEILVRGLKLKFISTEVIRPNAT